MVIHIHAKFHLSSTIRLEGKAKTDGRKTGQKTGERTDEHDETIRVPRRKLQSPNRDVSGYTKRIDAEHLHLG